MKKLSLLIALFSSLISLAQMANDKATISGQLSDFETGGTPLAFATVELIGTDKSTTTDLDGTFTIAGVEPGTYRLKVRFLGYQDLNTEEVYLEAHKTKNLSYSLKAKNISL